MPKHLRIVLAMNWACKKASLTNFLVKFNNGKIFDIKLKTVYTFVLAFHAMRKISNFCLSLLRLLSHDDASLLILLRLSCHFIGENQCVTFSSFTILCIVV